MIRLQIQNRPADELELISHVNETIGSLRRQIYIKTKLNPQINKIDLIINNECIECMEDNKTLGDYQLKEKLEKMYIVARITQSSSSSSHHHHHHHNQQAGGHHHQSPNLNLNLNSSTASTGGGGGGTTGTPTSGGGGRIESSAEDDDSSSSTTDECGSSQDNETGTSSSAAHHHNHNVVGSPNLDYELQLPSVILSLSEQYVQFLIDLADFGCSIRNGQIKECTRGIIDLLPIAKHTGERIKQLCKDCVQKQQQSASSENNSDREESGEVALEKFYTNCTQTQCWYNLKVTYALLLPAMHQFSPDETKQFQVKKNKK